MQKKIFALLTVVLFLPLLSSGAELSLGEKDTIFIDAVRIQPSLFEKAQHDGTSLDLQRAADTLEAEFTPALSATRVFQLVERNELATLAKEQELTTSGGVDAEYLNAAKSGRLPCLKATILSWRCLASLAMMPSISLSDREDCLAISAISVPDNSGSPSAKRGCLANAAFARVARRSPSAF